MLWLVFLFFLFFSFNYYYVFFRETIGKPGFFFFFRGSQTDPVPQAFQGKAAADSLGLQILRQKKQQENGDRFR